MIPNCAATRHAHFTLDGSGPSYLEKPNLNDWPKVEWKPSQEAIRVNLDTLTAEEVQSWKQGDRLLPGRLTRWKGQAVLIEALARLGHDRVRRSEERRVGQACVRTCRSRGSPTQKKKKKI